MAARGIGRGEDGGPGLQAAHHPGPGHAHALHAAPRPPAGRRAGRSFCQTRRYSSSPGRWTVSAVSTGHGCTGHGWTAMDGGQGCTAPSC